MPTMNLRRAIAFPILAALLAVGGMACIFGGGGNDEEVIADLTERLEKIEAQNTSDLVRLGLLEDDVAKLKEDNLALATQVDQQALIIEGMQAQAAAAEQTAMEDEAALKRFIECTTKSENPGAPSAVIAMASGIAETALKSEIASGSMTYAGIRAMLPAVCAGQ